MREAVRKAPCTSTHVCVSPQILGLRSQSQTASRNPGPGIFSAKFAADGAARLEAESACCSGAAPAVTPVRSAVRRFAEWAASAPCAWG